MIAYFDCFSGISGDMALGALMDLGVPLEWLKAKLANMPLDQFDLQVEREARHGIQANRLRISIAQNQPARDYRDIQNLIQNSSLSSRVQQMSLAIFDRVAAAEAKIHGVVKDHVHFHEVGALDSIVDIVGVALCLEYLDITKVIASKIPLGKGFVSCRHGILPVPAPATLEILKHVPVMGTSVEQELVTPTGAAIIAEISDSFGCLPEMHITHVGYGAGQRKIDDRPNLLRVIMGSPDPITGSGSVEDTADSVVVVETCIDDMNPELFGYLMERLFQDGALDVYWIPVYMKKNRPGTMVQVICPRSKKHVVVERILAETTSIGVRFYDVHREKLARKRTRISTRYGDVEVKCIYGPGERVRLIPEYEVCRKIAQSLQVPLTEVYAEISKVSADNSLTSHRPNCRDDS